MHTRNYWDRLGLECRVNTIISASPCHGPLCSDVLGQYAADNRGLAWRGASVSVAAGLAIGQGEPVQARHASRLHGGWAHSCTS